jgi:hypothetical protein
MWIKRENCQTVNTDLVQTIYKSGSGGSWSVNFFPVRSQSSVIEYFFKTKEARDEYYEAVMLNLGAIDL